MFVVFEGIDGSGKTTLSNLVAGALRRAGLRVEHVREDGRFASTVTQALRELGRDQRHVALTPRAELLLFLTRDVQLYEEATRPALARAEVVIADRFFYTADVLARCGRGVAAEVVTPFVEAAIGGDAPELVVLVDVEPQVARARRQVAKILVPDPRPGSRKGLAGAGLQQRLRAGYRELAARDPDRWLIVDNTSAELGQVVAVVAEAIAAACRSGVAAMLPATRAVLAAMTGATIAAPTVEDARAAFLAWVDARAAREPALAAHFLAGLAGPAIDPRRHVLAATAPAVIAAGLRGLTDAVSWRLRAELAAVAPAQVAASLVGLVGAEAQALLVALAPIAPAEVAAALVGRDDDDAWAVRGQLAADGTDAVDAMITSLGRVASARAWTARDHWLDARGGVAALARLEVARAVCLAITGLDEPRAWALREAAREVAPIAALDSTAGLRDDHAWAWRERYLARAPRAVMRTIAGLVDPRAWALRTAVIGHCKEALDSIVGLDGADAWALRAAGADLWPSTVVSSLGTLAATAAGHALLAAQLAGHPANLALWRAAWAISPA